MPVVLDVETRDVWEAMPPRSTEPLKTPAIYVFLAMQTQCEACHDSQQCQALIREMQFEHRDYLMMPDIKYNFLIGGNGKIYEGRGWNVRPSLPDKYTEMNERSIYIACIGDLREEATEEQELARDKLLLFCMETNRINPKHLSFLLTKVI